MNQSLYSHTEQRAWLEVRFTQADEALHQLAFQLAEMPLPDACREELQLIRKRFLKLNEQIFPEQEQIRDPVHASDGVAAEGSSTRK